MVARPVKTVSAVSCRVLPRHRGSTVVIVLVVAVLAIAAVALLAWFVSRNVQADAGNHLTAVIQRTDFIHDVVESGEVESADNTEIKCQVKGRNGAGTTILEVHVNDGDSVPPGELLVTLDSSALEVELQQERIIRNNKEANRDQAFNLLITAISALIEYVGHDEFSQRHREAIENDIARKAAEAIVNIAADSPGEKTLVDQHRREMENEIVEQGVAAAGAVLAKYMQVEDSELLSVEKIKQAIDEKGAQEVLPEIQKLLESEITLGSYHVEQQTYQAELFLAEENLRTALQYFRYNESLAAQGYVTELQLKSAEFSVDKARKDRDAAQAKLDVLRIHTKAKTEKTLLGDIYNSLAVYLAEKDSANIQRDRVQEIASQLEKCIIKAPEAGRVVFANQQDRRGNDDFVVEAGTTVREGQVIIRMPKSEDMRIEAKVNESKIALIKEDKENPMRATITIDAFDGMILEGIVTRVSRYPEPGHWFSSSVKEYTTEIQILNSPPELKSGLTAKVRIHAQEIENVVQAPIQSIHRHGNKYYCFVKDQARWKAEEVTLGASNEKFVVIEGGVEPGAEVSMNPASLLEDVELPEIKVGNGKQLAIEGTKPNQYTQVTAPSPSDTTPTDDKSNDSADGDSAPPTPAKNPATIAATIFTKADANNDGKLTEDELPEQFRGGFAETDSNSDGAIDRAELTAAMTKRMKNRAGPGGPNGGGPAGAGQ